MQIFESVTLLHEIACVSSRDVLGPGPHPLPDSIKDERLESVGKKFTWRKNKHRVECGGDGKALHGPMQIDRDGSGHILRR